MANEFVNKHFDAWQGCAPGGSYCAHCCGQFVPGGDFLIGRTISVADVIVCSAECAVAELAVAGLRQPRSRAQTVPDPGLLQPHATLGMPFETWRLRSEGGK